MRSLFLLCILSLGSVLAGQSLDVMLTVGDATCRANGTLSIAVTGGSGSYRYALSNDCGGSFPTQTTPDYNTLEPCNYILETLDRENGATSIDSFTVLPNNELLAVATGFDVCDAIAVFTGGLGPYDVTYSSTNGLSGTGVFDDTLRVSDLADGVLSGTVIDGCGNSRDFAINGAATRVRNFRTDNISGGVRITPTNGTGPFTFTLMSSAGVVTNTTGEFTLAEVACDPVITISGQCANAPLVEDFQLRNQATIDLGCINFTDGTATISVDGAFIPPLTFFVITEDDTIVTMDTLVSGIPNDARSVRLVASDGCGRTIRGREALTPLRLITPGVADMCTDTSLNFTVGRACGDLSNFPVTARCTTCPDGSTLTQTAGGDELELLNGAMIGNYELILTDACGDRTICRDTAMLELIPACDSILANYVQVFNCENGTRSRRPIIDTSVRYTLLDTLGAVLEQDNTNGRFVNLMAGRYVVELTSQCEFRRDTVELTTGTSINPFIVVDPDYVFNAAADSCELTYRVSIGREEGPYSLQSLDDNSVDILVNDFDLSECSGINVLLRLAPGNYRLTSLSSCGELPFLLPDVNERRIDSIRVDATCPGASQITIAGTIRSVVDWRNFYAGLGLRAVIASQEADYYLINDRVYRNNVIRDLAPGTYTVGVGIGFGPRSCLVDSMTFTIPEYEIVDLLVDGNYVCDNTGTAPLSLTPIRGNGPYTINRIDCDDPTVVLESFDVATGDSLMASTSELGPACYVVSDACGLTSDFQVEIRSLNEQLAVSYLCDPAVELFTDTFPGQFTWFDATGASVGSGNTVRVAPSLDDRTFDLEVMTNICLLTATLDVPGRPIVPALQIDPDNADGEYFSCGGDAIRLAAASDNLTVLSWNGNPAPIGDSAILNTAVSGIYRLTAFNDLGCTAMDSVAIIAVDNPAPDIQPAADNCPGGTLRLGIQSPTGADVVWNDGQGTGDTLTLSAEGENTVLVTSVEGCVGVDTFTYDFPAPITFSAQTDSVSCFGLNDGRVTVFADGGTGALSYRIGAGDLLPVGTEDAAVFAGTYPISINDANGCTVDTLLSVGQPDSLLLDIGPDLFIKLGDEIRLVLLTNAVTIQEIFLNGNPAELDSLSQALRLRPTESGNLEVNISDERGCVASDLIFLIVDNAINFYAPTAFSPNGDGRNDNFTIYGADNESARINLIQVFDRWGNLVFERENLSLNDLDAGWDGKDENGRPLNPGAFVWRAQLGLLNDSEREMSGIINLVR